MWITKKQIRKKLSGTIRLHSSLLAQQLTLHLGTDSNFPYYLNIWPVIQEHQGNGRTSRCVGNGCTKSICTLTWIEMFITPMYCFTTRRNIKYYMRLSGSVISSFQSLEIAIWSLFYAVYVAVSKDIESEQLAWWMFSHHSSLCILRYSSIKKLNFEFWIACTVTWLDWLLTCVYSPTSWKIWNQ